MIHPKSTFRLTQLLLSIALLAMFPTLIFSQDEMGQSLSNYSPTTTLKLNPASIADSKVWLDIHLVGAGLSVHNDFAYMPGNDFNWSMLWKNPEAIPDPNFNRNRAKYMAHAEAFGQLPGFSLVLGKNSLAINTGVRSITDIRGLPEHLANYAIEGFQWADQMGEAFSATNMRIASLNFAQVGLSYARMLKVENNEILSAGITVNRFIGIGGAGITIENWDYTVIDSLNLQTSSINGKYGVTEPAFNNGRGWGVDLGIMYKKTRSSVDSYVPHDSDTGCRSSDYIHKIGVAVLDLGRISFDPVFYAGTFSNAEPILWEDYSNADPEDLEELIDLLDEELSDGNVNASDTPETEQFRMLLPTALSFQYDRWINGPFYIGSTLVQGFGRKNNFGPQRMSQLALIPRAEWKRLELSIPIVLRNYRDPSLGVMLRINSIIIGSDRIGSWIPGVNPDVYGADFYIHFKYSIFNRSACKGKSSRVRASKGKSKSGKVLPCPSW